MGTLSTSLLARMCQKCQKINTHLRAEKVEQYLFIHTIAYAYYVSYFSKTRGPIDNLTSLNST